MKSLRSYSLRHFLSSLFIAVSLFSHLATAAFHDIAINNSFASTSLPGYNVRHIRNGNIKNGCVEIIDPAHNRTIATVEFMPESQGIRLNNNPPCATCAYVANFVVHPNCRQCGLGKGLFFKELPKILRECGYATMCWDAGPFEVNINFITQYGLYVHDAGAMQHLTQNEYDTALKNLIKFYENGGATPNKDNAGNYIYNLNSQSHERTVRFTYALTAGAPTQPTQPVKPPVRPTPRKPINKQARPSKKGRTKVRVTLKKRTARKAAAFKAVKRRKASKVRNLKTRKKQNTKRNRKFGSKKR